MKLTHPETDETLEVRDDHADVYKSQGWVAPEKTEKSSKDSGKS